MPAAPQKKAVCKAALVNLDESSGSLLRDCFKQFRIHATDITTNDAQWLSEQKYDACVLRLEAGCESMLEAMQHVVPSLAWLIPVPFYFLEILVGLVQALVFMLLTAVFTLLICTHEEGEHPAHNNH